MKFSKTITYALLTLVGVLTLPEVQAWVSAHPAYAVLTNSAFIAILRFLTVSPLLTKDNKNDI